MYAIVISGPSLVLQTTIREAQPSNGIVGVNIMVELQIDVFRLMYSNIPDALTLLPWLQLTKLENPSSISLSCRGNVPMVAPLGRLHSRILPLTLQVRATLSSGHANSLSLLLSSEE